MKKTILAWVLIWWVVSYMTVIWSRDYRPLSSQIPSVKAFSQWADASQRIRQFDIDYYYDSHCVWTCQNIYSSSWSSWWSSGYSWK